MTMESPFKITSIDLNHTPNPHPKKSTTFKGAVQGKKLRGTKYKLIKMIAFRQKYQQEAKEPHCPFKMQYQVKNRVGSEKIKGT